MLNSLFSLGGLLGFYSGVPLLAAVGSASVNPQFDASSTPLLAVLLPILFLFAVIGIFLVVILIVSWWKIFTKAGRPGWAAIIPIYNIVVMLQIVDMSAWLVLLAFIPFVGSIAFFVVTIILNLKLAKVFGKSEGFAVGLILLPIVFVPILAFGPAQFKSVTPTNPVPPTPVQ